MKLLRHPRVGRWLDEKWPQVFLVVAVIALVLQLFPWIVSYLLHIIDFRTWPTTFWFYGNIGVVVLLVACRFGPGFYRDWLKHRQELGIAQARREKQQQARSQREQIEQMREAQKRRIY